MGSSLLSLLSSKFQRLLGRIPSQLSHLYHCECSIVSPPFHPSQNFKMASSTTSKLIVLHIGDPVKWNTEFYDQFSKDFTVIRPSLEERQRDEFMKALKEKRWGDFSAIFRPFWNTGGEMGRWNKEMIPLIPASCKIFASAGAGFDWADVDILADRGKYSSFSVIIMILTKLGRYLLLQQVR